MATTVFVGSTEYFPGVGQIPYEGRESDNPLAFKFYDADKLVGGKRMADHLRFAACYWHTFCARGSDPFGVDTQIFSWDEPKDEMDAARARLDAAFEFFTKLGVPYYCFHDRDMAPEGDSVTRSERNLQALVELAGERQKTTGMKLLWGTANLFSHPRYISVGGTGEILIAFENDSRLLVVDGDTVGEISFSDRTRRVTASFVDKDRLWIVNALDHEILEFELNCY